jgi:arsenate reductase (thioredoxin)
MPGVLILCTGNSARSQMAEGLLRREAGARWEVRSAGTHPTTVRPEAVAVCPVFPGNTRRLHWPFEDPAAVTGTAEAKLAAFRMVRDQIQARVREFVTAPSRSRF